MRVRSRCGKTAPRVRRAARPMHPHRASRRSYPRDRFGAIESLPAGRIVLWPLLDLFSFAPAPELAVLDPAAKTARLDPAPIDAALEDVGHDARFDPRHRRGPA